MFPTRVRERRFPTREELDAAAPRHPVVIDGAYALVLNTAALEAAGIDRSTPAPEGGAIVKDEKGEPTGLLRNVGPLLARFQPADGEEVPLAALEQVHRRYQQVGITSVIERGAGLGGYRAYEQLKAQGRLGVRATVTLRVSSDGSVAGTEAFIRSLPVTFGQGDDRLRVGPLKIVADGGILAGTSYMREPYGLKAAHLYGVDDPSYRGFLTLTLGEDQEHRPHRPSPGLADVRARHRRRGRGHGARRGGSGGCGSPHPRPALHADPRLLRAMPTPPAARRRLGVCVDTQPAWYYKDADALAAGLGEERLRPFIGLAEWLRAGAHRGPQHRPHVRPRSRTIRSIPTTRSSPCTPP